jgi:hypothetical protein
MISLSLQVSVKIAAAVAKNVIDTGRSTLKNPPTDLLAYCKSLMYSPSYSK